MLSCGTRPEIWNAYWESNIYISEINAIVAFEHKAASMRHPVRCNFSCSLLIQLAEHYTPWGAHLRTYSYLLNLGQLWHKARNMGPQLIIIVGYFSLLTMYNTQLCIMRTSIRYEILEKNAYVPWLYGIWSI